MQNSVNQIELQKSELRQQIEKLKQKIFEDQDQLDYQDQMRVERKLKEKNKMSEIRELQLTMESLKQNHEEHRTNLKSEAVDMIELAQAYEEKVKLLQIAKEKCSDDSQIKNVLMMRIKDLESVQNTKQTDKYNYDHDILVVQQRQSDALGCIKLLEDQMGNLGPRFSYVETSKKELINESTKKELRYKEELLRSEHHKIELREEAEILKNKIIALHKVLDNRDSSMNKIDQKIEELIKLRKDLSYNRDRDIENLLNF